MSLEELLSVTIVSASNAQESLTEAPATVIVITRTEIQQRGYQEMSEILDDLPGMDVVRPFGATYFKNYWRGYRNSIGDPFLVLLDGIVLNHLYFNTADVLVTLPLSNVERVEVVYGPASSVYGPNAFMGVINVITTREGKSPGASAEGRLTAGTADSRIADVTARYEKDDFSVRISGRFDDGHVDGSHRDLYEFTKDRYYSDRRLWGGFVDNPNLGGKFLSERRQRSADLRINLGLIEAGLLYQRLSSGNGTEYTGDRGQNNAVWSRPDLTGFVRVKKALSAVLDSSLLVRYRRSDVANDSYFLDSFNGVDEAGRPARLVQLSYWQALNSSWAVFQDFEAHPGRRGKGSGDTAGGSPTTLGILDVNFGFKYERKDLQKAYDINAGPALPASSVLASTYPYPVPPTESYVNANRITTSDAGIYAQAKVRIAGPHQVNLGLRYDRNSQYGGATTVRAGYVGDFGAWGAKALYGEAFQEPNARLLYGGWTGSGSDPSIDPEKSRTVELAGSYKKSSFSGLLSVYWVRNIDTIVNTAQGAKNIASRRVVGADLHLRALLSAAKVRVKGWTYISTILHEEESEGSSQSWQIGDLAHFKFMAGVTAEFSPLVSGTLRGRYIGMRETVITNPVGEVGGYATIDATFTATDLFRSGIGVSFSATNLLDRGYVQPGVREASAGTDPGTFDAAGLYSGSRSYYSSLLPQPGRAVSLSFLFRY
jgi:outer membrane cobalamin receptor